MNTQKAKSILKKAGLKKAVWLRRNFKTYKTGDYELQKIQGKVTIETFGNNVEQIKQFFFKSGFNAYEPHEGCGLIIVE